MSLELKRLSFRHKNNKFWYYILNYSRKYISSTFFQKSLKRKLNWINNFDNEYIQKRVNYYNKLNDICELSDGSTPISELIKAKKLTVYHFDSFEFTRYFKQCLRAFFAFGDVIHIPEEPTIVKSRPIEGNNANSIVLKLEKLRHFLLLKDTKPFETKKNMLVGRNKAQQPHRVKFLEMYFGHPMCNIGQVNRDINPQFIANRLTITEHLNYKYILCLEGWDVASNLKWVMSSNSLAVMTKPIYETWFMEGTLVPNYHYVLIKDDYSDLEERLNYYNNHTNEALEIIKNAHIYIEQFKNKKREDLISLLVLKKYFEKTGQNI